MSFHTIPLPLLTTTATAEFDYQSVRYSKAGNPSRWPQIDKLVIGFTHWGSLAADFTLGRMDGFQNQRPDDYDTVLDDAKSMHIILHDTTHKCAFQTNAEDLILHILLHRNQLSPPNSGSSLLKKGVEDLQFANADRRKISTREVMLNNREKKISFRHQFSSSELQAIHFKDEVKSLWSAIDGLWANSYADSSKSLKLNFDRGHVVSGWEYMQMVENSRTIHPKSITLGKSCGEWNHYAKDIQAVVLFGGNFGDILQPASPNTLCSGFRLLPKDKCYLALRTDTLETLYDRQGSLEDQKKLTGSGLTLQVPKNLFKPCDHRKPPNGNICCSHRVMSLVSQSALGKNHSPVRLQTNGAIIIGGEKHFFPDLFHREQEDKQSSKPRQQKHQDTYSTIQETVTMANKSNRESLSPPIHVEPTLDLAQKVSSSNVIQPPKSFHPSSYGGSLGESSVATSMRFSSTSSTNQASTLESISSRSLINKRRHGVTERYQECLQRQINIWSQIIPKINKPCIQQHHTAQISAHVTRICRKLERQKN